MKSPPIHFGVGVYLRCIILGYKIIGLSNEQWVQKRRRGSFWIPLQNEGMIGESLGNMAQIPTTEYFSVHNSNDVARKWTCCISLWHICISAHVLWMNEWRYLSLTHANLWNTPCFCGMHKNLSEHLHIIPEFKEDPAWWIYIKGYILCKNISWRVILCLEVWPISLLISLLSNQAGIRQVGGIRK